MTNTTEEIIGKATKTTQQEIIAKIMIAELQMMNLRLDLLEQELDEKMK